MRWVLTVQCDQGLRMQIFVSCLAILSDFLFSFVMIGCDVIDAQLNRTRKQNPGRSW